MRQFLKKIYFIFVFWINNSYSKSINLNIREGSHLTNPNKVLRWFLNRNGKGTEVNAEEPTSHIQDLVNIEPYDTLLGSKVPISLNSY